MLFVDVPTLPEIKALVSARADACVSIYVPTTPQTQHVGASRIAFGNQTKTALRQLERAELDKRRMASLALALAALGQDDDFWRVQAHTLAVLATPDSLRTFRLATAVPALTQVSDRFHIKPLIRAVAFPQTGYVLALSENAVRLVEVSADLPAEPVRVPDLPGSAADAVGRASVNNLTQNTRIANAEGQTVLLQQYARRVDAALRSFLAGRDAPLILAATEPLEPIFRGMNTYPALLPDGIAGSPDRTSDGDLASSARAVLDRHYAAEVAAARALIDERFGQGRATTDVGEAARAATRGAVELLLVDMDSALPGTIDDDTGAVTFASEEIATSYGVVDEIAGRAILTGAKVLAVRHGDLPDGAPLVATLRYAL